MGSCGHPGCRRLADHVGMNRVRVCDFCGAHNPGSVLFTCDNCQATRNLADLGMTERRTRERVTTAPAGDVSKAMKLV